MKNWQIFIFVSFFIITGCASSKLQFAGVKSGIEKVEVGMLKSSVQILVGEPDKIIQHKDYTVFYYENNFTSNCEKDLNSCMPIVFVNDRVVVIGHQWMQTWEKQLVDSKNKQKDDSLKQNGKHTQSATVQPKKESEKEDIKAEIERLEKIVRPIPISNTFDNLRIYRYLLKLDPDNQKYKHKVAFYEQRFALEKTNRLENIKKQKKLRKMQNEQLNEFKGNKNVQMKLLILGDLKFYVWIKNIGTATLLIDPKDFFLVCKNNRRYPVYRSKGFNLDLKPQEITEGEIAFAVYCAPKELIYTSPKAGKISQIFPCPEISTDDAGIEDLEKK
ncbi:MAG: hypothetical protein U9R19_17615 [Bacteroidota bacterium]|nr:hypothetical protein [Bacteroidota bacterium]